MNSADKPCFKNMFIPLLKKQLNGAKKPDLKTALENLNPHSCTTGTKPELIDQIANELFLVVIKFKEEFDSVNKAKQYLKNWFKNQFGQIIQVSKLDSMEDFIKAEFTGLESSKSLKNVRGNQIMVSNIWKEQKVDQYDCICPKGPSSICGVKICQICYKCGVKFHIDCIWGRPRPQTKTDTLSECPSCFLMNCLPHKRVEKVLFAGYLPTSKSNRLQFLINFKVSEEMKLNKKITFEARCIRMKSQNECNRYEMTWPDNSTVILNSQKMGEYKSLPTNTPLKRRADQELLLDKLSTYCGEYQSLIIEQKHEYDIMAHKYDYANHFMMIFAVANQNQEEIIEMLKYNRVSIAQSKQILKNYLSSSNNNDIQIEKLTIYPKCPLFFTKITIPVRSKHCSTHFQPFDLKNFISMNKTLGKGSAQKYKCPICKKRAFDLVVDDYLLQLMSSKNHGQHIAAIILRADGQPYFQEDNDYSDFQSQDQKPEGVPQNLQSQQIKNKLHPQNRIQEEQKTIPTNRQEDQDEIILIDVQQFQLNVNLQKNQKNTSQKEGQHIKKINSNNTDKNQREKQSKPYSFAVLPIKRPRQTNESDNQSQLFSNISSSVQKQKNLEQIRKLIKTTEPQKTIQEKKAELKKTIAELASKNTKIIRSTTQKLTINDWKQQKLRTIQQGNQSSQNYSNKIYKSIESPQKKQPNLNLAQSNQAQKEFVKEKQQKRGPIMNRISSQTQPTRPITFLQKPSMALNQKNAFSKNNSNRDLPIQTFPISMKEMAKKAVTQTKEYNQRKFDLKSSKIGQSDKRVWSSKQTLNSKIKQPSKQVTDKTASSIVKNTTQEVPVDSKISQCQQNENQRKQQSRELENKQITTKLSKKNKNKQAQASDKTDHKAIQDIYKQQNLQNGKNLTKIQQKAAYLSLNNKEKQNSQEQIPKNISQTYPIDAISISSGQSEEQPHVIGQSDKKKTLANLPKSSHSKLANNSIINHLSYTINKPVNKVPINYKKSAIFMGHTQILSAKQTSKSTKSFALNQCENAVISKNQSESRKLHKQKQKINLRRKSRAEGKKNHPKKTSKKKKIRKIDRGTIQKIAAEIEQAQKKSQQNSSQYEYQIFHQSEQEYSYEYEQGQSGIQGQELSENAGKIQIQHSQYSFFNQSDCQDNKVLDDSNNSQIQLGIDDQRDLFFEDETQRNNIEMNSNIKKVNQNTEQIKRKDLKNGKQKTKTAQMAANFEDTIYFEDTQQQNIEPKDKTKESPNQKRAGESNLLINKQNLPQKGIKQPYTLQSSHQNTYQNPIDLEDDNSIRQKASPILDVLEGQNQRLNQNLCIIQTKPEATKQEKYHVQLQELRASIETKRKHMTEKVIKMYKIEPIKEDDERLFWDILNQVNQTNENNVFC